METIMKPTVAAVRAAFASLRKFKRAGMRRFSLHLKRALDIVLATTLLLLLMPLMAAISAAVAMDGGPIIHGHRRVGRNGKEFSCLKFRTMIMDAENCLSEYLAHHP